ncbi:phosphatase PAP2 family protein [Mesorhizobium sp. 113-3-3]|uniref:phosphatase PAP2 family protein n=1 Tax=Mesorhizobium sp. 113-3-3 TaxID=2744516 RepID=UPI001FD1A316|nr:phosphatase PAP2 family protein [Mesorhizobium sp. 113-3-3]
MSEPAPDIERRPLGSPCPPPPTGISGASAQDKYSLVAVMLVACLVLGFGVLAEEVLEGDTTKFDLAIMSTLRAADPANPIGPPWLQEAARDVTSVGSVVFLGFVLVAGVVYLLLIHKRALAIWMGVAVTGGELLGTILKLSFNRPRPEIPHVTRVFTASFPSGHAMLSAITFLTVGALLSHANQDRRLKLYFMALAVFLTVAVGVSRVYLAVHYPTDVLAGWCIGSGWAILCWIVALWFQERPKRGPKT